MRLLFKLKLSSINFGIMDKYLPIYSSIQSTFQPLPGETFWWDSPLNHLYLKPWVNNSRDKDLNQFLPKKEVFNNPPPFLRHVLPGRAQSPGSGHDPRAPRGLHRGGGRQSRRRSWIWSHLLRKPWTFETSIPIMLRCLLDNLRHLDLRVDGSMNTDRLDLGGPSKTERRVLLAEHVETD